MKISTLLFAMAALSLGGCGGNGQGWPIFQTMPDAPTSAQPPARVFPADAPAEDFDTVAEREAYVLSDAERVAYTAQSDFYQADPQAILTYNDVLTDMTLAALEEVREAQATPSQEGAQPEEAPALGGASPSGEPFFAVAHMTNRFEAVTWALREGANGIEIDLQFTANGEPQKFQHSLTRSSPCDCLVGPGSRPGVCHQLNASDPGAGACVAEEGALNLLTKIGQNETAKHRLAMVYIDSKFDNLGKSPQSRAAAGRNVVALIDQGLFAQGYRGQVIIGNPLDEDAYLDYTEAALEASKGSKWRDRYYFSIDKDATRRTTIRDTVGRLNDLTPQRVYTAGITALLPNSVPLLYDMYADIAMASTHFRAGQVSGAFVWTIDNPLSASRYIDLGATGVLTNEPGMLLPMVKAAGLALAQPYDGNDSQAMKPARNAIEYSMGQKIQDKMLVVQDAVIDGVKKAVDVTVDAAKSVGNMTVSVIKALKFW